MKLLFLGTGTSVGVPMVGCDASCLSRIPQQRAVPRCSFATGGAMSLIDTTPEFRMQALRFGITRGCGVVSPMPMRTTFSASTTQGVHMLQGGPFRYTRHRTRWPSFGACSVTYSAHDRSSKPEVDSTKSTALSCGGVHVTSSLLARSDGQITGDRVGKRRLRHRRQPHSGRIWICCTTWTCSSSVRSGFARIRPI